jgi:hypothetical protein
LQDVDGKALMDENTLTKTVNCHTFCQRGQIIRVEDVIKSAQFLQVAATVTEVLLEM